MTRDSSTADKFEIGAGPKDGSYVGRIRQVNLNERGALGRSRLRRYTIVKQISPMLWLGLGLVLILSGCTPIDRVSARVIDDELAVVFCDQFDAQSLLVLEAKDDGRFEYSTIWEATGRARVDSDVIIKYGTSPPGLATDIEPSIPAQQGSLVEFRVSNENDSRSFAFERDELSADWWFTQSGERRDLPC